MQKVMSGTSMERLFCNGKTTMAVPAMKQTHRNLERAPGDIYSDSIEAIHQKPNIIM